MLVSTKKGEGGLKILSGGGSSQNSILKSFEETLELTAKDAAKVIGTSYNTYKSWKSEHRQMTGSTIESINKSVFIHSEGLMDRYNKFINK